MTKFIIKGIIFICFILIFSLNTVFASSQEDYYLDLLDSWDIKSSIYFNENGNTNSKNDENLTIKDFQVIPTSNKKVQDFTNGFTGKSGNILFICNSDFESIWLNCNSNNVYVTEGDLQSTYLGEKVYKDGNLYITTVKINNSNIIVIPSQYFYTPEYQEKVKKYLVSLKKAHNVDISTPPSVVLDSNIPIVNQDLIHLFYYSLLLFLFLIVFRKFLITIVQNSKQVFVLNTYTILFDRFKKYVDSTKPFILVMILLLLIFGLLLWGYVGGKIYKSIPDLFDLNFFAHNSENIKDYVLRVAFYVFSLFYVLILTSLFGLYHLTNILNFVLIVKDKVFTTSLKSSFIKFVVPFSLLILLIISLFFNIAEWILLISLVMFLLIYVSILCIKQNINSSALYTHKEKIFIIFIFAFIIISGAFFSKRGTVKVIDYEDLLGTKDDLVMLPYHKTSSDNVLFSKFLIKSSSNIFVDNYLIYSPNFKNIRNNDLNTLKDTTESTIVIGNIHNSGFINELKSNQLLKTMLLSKTISTYMYIDTNTNNPALEMEINIDCRNIDYQPSVLTISSLDTKIQNFDLLYFSGCLGNEIESFIVPLYIQNLDSKIYEVGGTLTGMITEIKLLDFNKVPLNNFFIEADNLGAVYVQTAKKGNIVNTYAVGNKVAQFQNLHKEENDISESINFLKKSGYIQKNFLIWSDAGNVPIVNNL